jgi:hypothetical protein
MCPVPGDDAAPSVIPGHWSSRHSGPGYAANPKAPDFELDEPLRDAAARWLNLVPAAALIIHLAPCGWRIAT